MTILFSTEAHLLTDLFSSVVFITSGISWHFSWLLIRWSEDDADKQLFCKTCQVVWVIFWCVSNSFPPANPDSVLLTLCRRMPSSGQRQHQSRRRQQSRPAVLLPQLPAAAPLEAPPWPRLVPRMPLGRKAATPPRPLLLPVETMMVTLHHALLTTRAMFSRGVLFWSVDHRLCFLFFIASRQQQKPKTELSRADAATL